MKPLTVIADGEGMARGKNPHPEYDKKDTDFYGDTWPNSEYKIFETMVESLPIYKNGQSWMGSGETQAELVWMYQNPINDVWLRCDNQMKGYDCKQIYIIPGAREAEDDYIPFGGEWQKHIMGMPKKFIMEMLRDALMKQQQAGFVKKDLLELINQL